MKRLLILMGLLALAACDDATATDVEQPDQGVADSGPEPDMAQRVPDAGPEPDMALPDAAPMMEPVGWIEVTLSPRVPMYRLDQSIRLSATVYDRFGGEIEDATVKWEVDPPEMGTVSGDRLTTTGEGQGRVLGCLGPVCGFANFYVDAESPTLIVTEPERGALLGGDASRTIRVRGTATDSRGEVDVRINGFRVDLNEAGQFSFDLPAQFGVNAIRVTADDGARDATVDERDVMWAPFYSRVDGDRAIIDRAVSLRLDQALLDTDAPLVLPEGAGTIETTELALALETMAGLIDPTQILEDPNLVNSGGLTLRVDEISFGEPDVELVFTETGMELFLELPAVTVETTGGLDLDGEGISLDGSVSVSVSAFASIEASLIDGSLSLEVSDYGLSIGQIVGNYASPTVGVLLATVGSRLRDQIVGLAEGLIDGLMQEQLPAILSQGLDGLLGAFSEIPLDLDTGLEGVPPLRLTIRMVPAHLELLRHEQMLMALRAELIHEGPVVAPHDDPGIPSFGASPEREAPGDGLAAIVDLELINALLHEIWRSGLLQISPPLPDQAAALIRAVRVDGRMTPVVAPAPPGSALPLQVQVGDLRLYATGRLSEEPDVYAMNINVGLSVEAVDGVLQLRIAESPDISAVLIEQPGANPILNAAAIAGLVEAVVWPQVEGALAGGLSLPLDTVDVPVGGFQAYTPRLQGMQVTPDFEGAPIIDRGRLVLEGDLRIDLEVSE